METRDDGRGQRHQWRRVEDSLNASNAHRIAIVERIALKHEKWFEDLGVGDMSLEQRNALPGTLEATVETKRERERWRKRSIGLVGLSGFVGSVFGPQIAQALGHIWKAIIH